jgi:hypothetical protein
MGTYTRVDGEIRIEPPLTWSEFKDSPFNTDSDNVNLCVRLDVAEEVVETDDGTLTRKTARAVIPIREDSYKAYRLTEEVQQVIDSFPQHVFTGRLECEGEQPGDLWRVVVRNRRAEEIRPKIVWPDED